MWYQILLILTFSYTILALSLDSIDFSIDYFKYRNIKFICLMTCQQDTWPHKFSKQASNNTIAVSKVYIHSDVDVNKVAKCLEYKLQSIGVLFNADCENAEQVMYFASENLSYSAQHKWLIIKNDEVIPSFYNKTEIDIFHEACEIGSFDKLNISVDSDIIVGSRDMNGYTLYEVFNFGAVQGGKLVVNSIGSWNDSNGLSINIDLNRYKYYRRWNFQNITLRMVLAVSEIPKVFEVKRFADPKPIPGFIIISQTAGSILYLMAELHNFRYNHTFTDRWISTFERNSTMSVATSIYLREQDISPVIRLLPFIFDKIDILMPPLASIETRYYYRIPTTGPGKLENQFLMPLSPVAWWGVVGVSVLCAFLLMLSALFEHRPSSIQYAVFSVLASICQQFYEDSDEGRAKRVSTARKVTIFVTGLSCVLIYNYYTSSVVSWLLNGPPPSINSLKELLESPLELIFEDIGYTRSWLQTPSYYYNKRNAPIEDELRQKKVFNKKKGAPLLVPLEQGIRMVKKGGYAYHTEVSSANRLISQTFDQTELCETGSLQSMEKTLLYSCMPKNSPFKEFVTWSLMRLQEQGFVNCMQSRTASLEVKCEGSSPRALALGGAAPAFILLAGGYTLAIIIMLVERFIYKIKNGLLAIGL